MLGSDIEDGRILAPIILCHCITYSTASIMCLCDVIFCLVPVFSPVEVYRALGVSLEGVLLIDSTRVLRF
jgi:hypothetical protein